MKQKIELLFILILLFTTTAEATNYLLKQDVQLFIDDLVKTDKLDRVSLEQLFSDVKYQQTALSFYSKDVKPLPDKSKTNRSGTKCRSSGSWDRYSHNLLKSSKVQKGKAYMLKHRKILNRAYQKYGISPEYITAIIGIESHYGANTGQYPVFDTLATLAFEPNRRNSFFKSELRSFLNMTDREGVDPSNVKGSYAGAIGLCQFMPSNYKKLAIDFNNDGKISMNNHIDAIGSVANYLKQSGWRRGQEVAIPVSFLGHRYLRKDIGYRHKYSRYAFKDLRPKRATNYKGDIYIIKLQRSRLDEVWFGTKNFYAITRYNHSDYYAMAVHQLAQKIMGRKVSQSSGIRGGFIKGANFKSSDLDNFLDSPLKGRKFIIDL
ncbi:MAG: lytic murein transglycosylase B [Campylobacterota bacterium]|nr:lytic murein transglycosylase B [Campylobacterota bacterium]